MRLGPQARGGFGRGVALDEGERDGRIHLGEDLGGARPERLEQAAQLVGEGHARGHQVVAPAHEGAQRAHFVALGGQGLEAMAIGAQQIGEQIGVAGVALGPVAAVARARGLDGVGVNGHDGEAGFEQRVDHQARGPLDGHRGTAVVLQAALELDQAGRVMRDLEVLECGAAFVEDAHRMGSAGPVQPGIASAHGQTPTNCAKTRRAGSPRGTLTDRRSWLHTMALHPVARLGLPAPRRLRVSCGPSSGQRAWQSLRGHGSPNETSVRAARHVKPCAHPRGRAEHGLSTASLGRFVAGADRPTPWATLHRGMPAPLIHRKVVQ